MATTDFYEIDCDELDFPNLMKEHPTATMIKNIDTKKEFERAMALTIKLDKRQGKWKSQYEVFYTYKNLYGTTKNIDDCKKFIKMLVLNPRPMGSKLLWTEEGQFHYKYYKGIEVIFMKNCIRLQDLKTACKKNGLKGYSNKNKVELFKMLMSI